MLKNGKKCPLCHRIGHTAQECQSLSSYRVTNDAFAHDHRLVMRLITNDPQGPAQLEEWKSRLRELIESKAVDELFTSTRNINVQSSHLLHLQLNDGDEEKLIPSVVAKLAPFKNEFLCSGGVFPRRDISSHCSRCGSDYHSTSICSLNQQQ